MTTTLALVRSKLASGLLLLLTLLVPVTGFVAVRAYTTATTAACAGSNDAKVAVNKFVTVLIDRAEAPIVNGTPEQLKRQADSVSAYKQTRRDAAKFLAQENC